ncbi:MAG: hypothetical protein AB1333_03910 [Patescibacteria group bacterium]
MITSKSPSNANIVFLFDKTKFFVPENSVFGSLYSGVEAAGARFLDDPIIHAKVLTLPNIQTRITLEENRLRIDDDSGKNPEESRVCEDAFKAREKLFPSSSLEAFGFNFDIQYRFSNVIPLNDFFEKIFNPKIYGEKDLRDFGFQCTLNNSKKGYTDTFFFKIVSPLELSVHLNRHFSSKEIPKEKKIKELFLACYEDVDSMVLSIKI